MIYVMSDIHGEYNKYVKMLDKINLTYEDTLYILGDVVDRGEKPMSILLDMMSRPNIYPIWGNHDLLALDLLKRLNVEITIENYDKQIDSNVMSELIAWIKNGGESTISDFRKLDKETRLDIIDYLQDFMLYDIVDINDKKYILVHAGLDNFRPDKKLSEYTADELTWCRIDPDVQYFANKNVYVVVGHTPTFVFDSKDKIYKSHNNICIDCGASIDGKLGCLCLDTMEEFYI